MPVLEVGTGVGYLYVPLSRACRLAGRGSTGDDDWGSKAGRSEAARRFVPAMVLPVGEESIANGG